MFLYPGNAHVCDSVCYGTVYCQPFSSVISVIDTTLTSIDYLNFNTEVL